MKYQQVCGEKIWVKICRISQMQHAKLVRVQNRECSRVQALHNVRDSTVPWCTTNNNGDGQESEMEEKLCPLLAEMFNMKPDKSYSRNVRQMSIQNMCVLN